MSGLYTAFTDIADAVREKTGSSNTMTPSEMATAIASISGGLEGGVAHNSIYRGENLGSSVTSEQFTSIADGSFKDMYIGDYWLINNNEWRIAAFDYWLNMGDQGNGCETHHVVIVPDRIVGAMKKMEDTNITTNGYGGSKMRTEYISEAKGIIETDFGSDHILTHRDRFSSASSNGYPSSTSWYDATVEIMSERQVYGCQMFAASSPQYSAATTKGSITQNYQINYSQFPLFAYDRNRIVVKDANGTARSYYWLNDVVSATTFADVFTHGVAADRAANGAAGVRPCFGIVG